MNGNEGLTLESQLWNSLRRPIYVINSIYTAKLPCYNLSPTQHHSFFRNVPSVSASDRQTITSQSVSRSVYPFTFLSVCQSTTHWCSQSISHSASPSDFQPISQSKLFDSPTITLRVIFHQKNTKYKSISAKIESYNKTIDVSTLDPSDNITVYNNGTHNYTTITKVIYPASDTIPNGQRIANEGGMNVLGLVMFSIVFGIVLGRMGEKGLPLKAFFETLNEVVMKMVALVMWYVDQFQTRLFV